MQVLVVVDMQNDFIYDALGSDEAIKIVPYVKKLIDEFDGEVIYNENNEYIGRTEKYWVYIDSLQSVTAVIDNNIYKIKVIL